MGFATLMANCYVCGRPFGCSPTKVPSIPAHLSRTGQREPVCQACIEKANPLRVAKGLPAIEILPGAYLGDPDTPESELELDRELGRLDPRDEPDGFSG
jgi:hypothetical protein